MKITKKKALYIFLLLTIIIIVAIRLKSNKEVTEKKVYQYDKKQALNVQADTLKIEEVSAIFSYSGTFDPNKETKISTEVQGRINDVLVNEGNYVKKGQSLIQLDNSLLKLQLQNAGVQIEGLEADVKRYSILVKADAVQGIQLEKAELGLKSAKVQRATLREQINKTTIKAPFNGIVTAKLSEEGAFAAPGVPLLQITDLAQMKFTVNVPENNLSQFLLNQTYSITADAYPDNSLSGKATLIGSKANMGNSFPVQFTVNNIADFRIKAGMFGKVKIENPEKESGIIIPSSAITGTAEQPQVYLIKNGKATLQNITVLKRIKNQSIISSGLNEGDVIVTSGIINLFNGANVTVK